MDRFSTWAVYRGPCGPPDDATRSPPCRGPSATVDPVVTLAAASLRRPRFTRHDSALGRAFYVADELWRIPPRQALATVVDPCAASASRPSLSFDLRDRQQRGQCYEILLVDGTPDELAMWMDGLFLAELWDDLMMPRTIRGRWQPVIDAAWAL